MKCDVQVMARGRACGAEPARRFTARCKHEHPITGYACESCSRCKLPRCLRCWRGGKGHQCPVEFISAECLCGCEQPVPIATRNQTRERIVKGRPVRYIPGHNLGLETAAMS